MATSSDLRPRRFRTDRDSLTSQVVNAALSRNDISNSYGRLALRCARKRFILEMLTALQDSATGVPRIYVQAELCLALLVIVASLGVLFLAAGTSQEEKCINRFGERDQPCPHRQSTGGSECYQRVDVHGRVLYTRDLDGFHFEMNPKCSTEAPEDDTMKCRGEWSFTQESHVVWYLRRYLNVTSGTESLVSLPRPKDPDLRLMAMRWIHRTDDPQHSTWVFSSASIPRDDFPEAEVVMDGTMVIGQMVVTSSK